MVGSLMIPKMFQRGVLVIRENLTRDRRIYLRSCVFYQFLTSMSIYKVLLDHERRSRLVFLYIVEHCKGLHC